MSIELAGLAQPDAAINIIRVFSEIVSKLTLRIAIEAFFGSASDVGCFAPQ